MIRIEGVSKRFGRASVVRGVTLEIPEGDSVALWGENGAGKTTLIRCVLGLLRFEGRIEIGGHDVARAGKWARMMVGYVPQELGFYDDLQVAEAVRFFGKLKGIVLRETVGVLRRVGLEGHGSKRIRELSGGMKQRLALAIALMGDPPVLVLDEVTASLDACGRRELVGMLSGLSGSGRTMLFASHRVDEVTTLARRVVTLRRGEVAGVDGTAQFVRGLGAGSTLHLSMRADVRARAMSVLSERGYAAEMNGVGLLVPVPSEQKAGPFRVLAEARIAVDDFEVIDGAGGARGEGG